LTEIASNSYKSFVIQVGYQSQEKTKTIKSLPFLQKLCLLLEEYVLADVNQYKGSSLYLLINGEIQATTFPKYILIYINVA